MLEVEVGKGGIEAALKKLKRKWDKTKMIKELRSRKEFIKTSVKKRNVLNKAKYVQKNYKNNSN